MQARGAAGDGREYCVDVARSNSRRAWSERATFSSAASSVSVFLAAKADSRALLSPSSPESDGPQRSSRASAEASYVGYEMRTST
jgi:hypothetical protein